MPDEPRKPGPRGPAHFRVARGNAAGRVEPRTIHEYRPTSSQTLPGPLRARRIDLSQAETASARQRARALLALRSAVAVVVTAMIVHGSGPPFTFRLGERPDRELRVNVKEFKLRNQTKTSNERQAAADQVAPEMVNDPAPIRELAEKLDDLTTAVARSGPLRGSA